MKNSKKLCLQFSSTFLVFGYFRCYLLVIFEVNTDNTKAFIKQKPNILKS